jgi:hypothetical protein
MEVFVETPRSLYKAFIEPPGGSFAEDIKRELLHI